MVRRLRQKLFVKLARISAGRMGAASDFKPSYSPKVHRKERIIHFLYSSFFMVAVSRWAALKLKLAFEFRTGDVWQN
ncbi:hypothetical protein MKN04_23355 [Paenibacillus polymyxa]|uniref:hypothetical protein n=1 Tax=Paenibacillus polymyxa TaxID=1406 RepID=UPI0004D4A7FC|nr:hypothetical protein [Paenibacillus polymyxa]KEO76848.1 hypothetical protein EL23_21285 [Paenibacillus polymyxa]MCH6190567.1 hypothetical protein [Paenibacillus polymyxa]MDY8095998.1 hypothetical protein [Paenibacillus polymyxa]WRL56768.1 hypothetical protein U3G77_00225 [Paenibacillus polymyxa]